MSQLKVGIQLGSLRQPFKKALLTAARLGADAVEIDVRNEVRPDEFTQTGIRQLRKMLEDLNLRVCAVSFRTRRGYNHPDDLDRRVAATKKAMQFAFDLRAPVVINQIGQIPSDSSGPAWDMLIQSLTDLGRHGQHVGAFLAAETGTEEGTVLAGLIDALPPGSLTVNLDPGNLIINTFSVADAVQALGPHVRHVHAKDGVRDLAQGRGIEVPMGRGSVDFPELIGRLEEFEYRGYYTIERENSSNPEFEIGEAVKYLRNV